MSKIQKQYQRKVKVSQNNDIFTTFQRHSNSNCSNYKIQHAQKSQSFHQNQHEHIESLKNTLKSLIPVSMQMTKPFSKNYGFSSQQSQSLNAQSDQYSTKLDQLTKNLQQIAAKCHFSPANVAGGKVEQFDFTKKEVKNKSMFQKSQTLSRYQPIQSEHFYRYSNSTSIQIPKNKSQSFIDKQISNHKNFQFKSPKQFQNPAKKSISHQLHKSKSKSKSKTKLNQADSNNKKSFSKKQFINDSLNNLSMNKNLGKLFQTYDNNPLQALKGRQRSQTYQMRRYQTIFKQRIHRAKITSILVADQIYSSSLDSQIKRTYQNYQGRYQSALAQQCRGGVQFIGVLSNKIFGCGRDYYLRSIDGNFFCRFDKVPLSFSQTERSNAININFANNELKLFDLEKRQCLSSILIQNKYTILSKIAKQSYLGVKSSLFALDWRKKQHLVNVYKDLFKDSVDWISDPYSKLFWYHFDGELTILNQDFKKKGTKKFPSNCEFLDYHWGRNGLNILSEEGFGNFKVHHYEQFKQREQLDSQQQVPQLTKLLIREKQLIYCSKLGQLVIKNLKK